jgi:hypothetical protein
LVSPGLDTPDVFVIVMVLVVAFVAVETTVTVTLDPAPTLVNEQESGLLLLQLPLLGAAEANARPLGSRSVTVTLDAIDGPLFVATRVKVASDPDSTVWLAGDLVIPRSTAGMIVTFADAKLLAVLVSFGTVMPAVFIMVTGLDVAFVAVATTVTVTLPPMPTFVKVHRSGLLLLHEPVLGVAEASVSPAGRLSVRVTVAAIDGPLLFVATSVKVTGLPVLTVCDGGFLVRPTSEIGVMVTITGVEVSGVGSVGLPPVAVFRRLMSVAVVLAAVATTVTVTLEPTPTFVKRQLIGLVVLFTQEPPFAETGVRPS